MGKSVIHSKAFSRFHTALCLMMVAVLLAAAGIGTAFGAQSLNRGSAYDHVDVKLAASYTVNIDGVDYKLSGTPVQDSIVVKVDGKTFNFGAVGADVTTRSEGDHYEYNLSTSKWSPSIISWESDSSWTMTNVTVSADIKLDVSHLSSTVLQHLVNIGLITLESGSYYVSLDNVSYSGVQECTGGNGKRSDGYRGTPSGLDLVLSAEDTALAITEGKLVIQKRVLDSNGSLDGNNSAEFAFTLQIASGDNAGKYVVFEDNAYKGLSEAPYEIKLVGNQAVTLTGLPAGTYRITEIQREGYIIASIDGDAQSTNYSKDYVIETKEDSSIPVAIFTNKPLGDAAGISISKVTKQPEGVSVPNPHVYIYKCDITGQEKGELVWSGVVPANGDTLYLHNTLESGYYIVEEAGQSIDGYNCEASLLVNGASSQSGMVFEVESGDIGKHVSLVLKNVYAEGMDIPVKKVWFDGNAVSGRPDSVKVSLLANGEPTDKTLILSASNDWKGVFEDVAINDSEGNAITYSVQEESVSRYVASYSGNAAEGFVITNTELISVTIRKEWVHTGNKDPDPVETATVYLYTNGVKGKAYVLQGGGATQTVDGLPKYDAHGNKISYEFHEEPIVDYTPKHTVEDGVHVITNTYDPDHTSVEVIKVWKDYDNINGVRPSSIIVDLYIHNNDTNEDAWVEEAGSLVLDDDNGWTDEFTRLDRLGNGEAYVVKERDAAAPSKLDTYYELKSTKVEGSMVGGYTVTLTNTLKTDYAPISVAAKKVWNDANDQDGIRPDKVTLSLFASVDGQKTLVGSKVVEGFGFCEWTDLPRVSASGNSIAYTVEEPSVPAGYISEVTVEDGVFVVTNTHEPDTTSVSVIKRWVDNCENEAEHPEVVVGLYRVDDAGAVTPVTTLDESGNKIPVTITLTSEAGWAGHFVDLPAYDQGREIQYTVLEENVPTGYTSTVLTGEHNNFSVVNVREHIDIAGIKTWDDEDNVNDLRPESITVKLWGSVEGGQAVEVAQAVVTPDNNGEWTYSFINLHQFDTSGNEITYTVTEDAVEYYEPTVDGFNIVNKLVGIPDEPLPDTNGGDDGSDGPLSKTGDDLASKAGVLGILALGAAGVGVMACSKSRTLARPVRRR